MNTELKTCLNDKLPIMLKDVRHLYRILDFVESMATGQAFETNNPTSNVPHVLQELIEKLDVKYPEVENSKVFISEQIKLLACHKGHRHYSSDNMIFFSLLYSISPHAYKFLQHSGNLVVPHPTTIRKLCAGLHLSPYYEQFEQNFLCYAKEKFDNLKHYEKIVCLMMGEIHIKAYFDYKGGNIVGTAFNCEDAATSAHVFMVQSLLSTYKDVMHILPVKTISADILFSVLRKVILGLESIGFMVISVSADNNSINRKTMSFFANPPELKVAYKHPSEPSRPLFFVIDAVHILKCIRNNWLNQKNADKCMFYPDFDNLSDNVEIKTASFYTLRKLFDVEQNDLVTYNCKLSVKSLMPSNLERQNVKLVLQIFNEYVITALLDVGEKHNLNHYKETAKYIELIYHWWCIVNVKSPDKGRRLKNVYMEPLTSMENDERVDFLSKFLYWLNAWKSSGCTSGTLTKETHLALSHTTECLLKMSQYCINDLKMKYFLCGKVQTDTLEERFGNYRYMSGCQYNVSVRQIFESESKLRLQNSLQMDIYSKSYGKIAVDKFESPESWEELELSIDTNFKISITDKDLINEKHLMPILTFLAGYCIHIVCKRIKCNGCKDQLTVDKELVGENELYKLIADLDRGNLKYPQEDIIYIILNCFAVVKKLVSQEHEAEFLKVRNQRLILTTVTFNIIHKQEITYSFDICASGHFIENVVKQILWVASNILLKNYCLKKNDKVVASKICQKRKLSTFSNNTCKKVPETGKLLFLS